MSKFRIIQFETATEKHYSVERKSLLFWKPVDNRGFKTLEEAQKVYNFMLKHDDYYIKKVIEEL